MNRRNTPKILVIALFTLMLISCEETTIVKNYTGTGEEKTYSIEGYAQKGPFIVGTDVTVSELSEDLYPTGRVFFATILNDEGYFELPGVVLTSPYIQIKVRGRYFSETGGYIPPEELTLYSLADVTNSETINVNILTHLEKERVEYLVQEEGSSFDDAKAQAQEEVLKVFEWENLSVGESEQLNITDDNTGGAVLLAMSSLFEAIEFVSRLETITNFKVDFANDGILNQTPIQNRLLTSAAILNRSIVRHNMETKYEATMPDFESLLQQFVDNSSYTNYFDVVFPKTHNGKINLLRIEETVLNSANEYAFIVGAFPENVSVGEVLNTFSFYANFQATNEYPQVAPNSFELVSNSYHTAYGIGAGNCIGLGPEALCATGGFSLEVPENNTMIEIPVTFNGTGYLSVICSFDIDHSIRSFSKELTWQ